jgi:hypothetical protein
MGISGGVRTTSSKLGEALTMEGLNVKRVGYPGINPPTRFASSLRTASSICKEMTLAKTLKDFDTVIYIGSIAYLSHFLYFVPKKALVLHGFVQQEWMHWIGKHPRLVSRAFIMTKLRYWQLFNSNPKWNELDFLICRSETNAEANGISEDHVVLPNYVLPREIEANKTDFENYEKARTDSTEVRVLCYLSTVESPRLLNIQDIMRLYNLVTKMTPKKISFVLIDPLNHKIHTSSSNLFQVRPYASPEEWRSLMISCDLYLEACTDEELRNGAIEAGLLGVPFAKITYPSYSERQDYHENEVILGKSMEELAAKIAEYCNGLDYMRTKYSREVREFVTKSRSWDSIKGSLLQRII